MNFIQETHKNLPVIKEGDTEIVIKKLEILKDQSAARLEKLRTEAASTAHARKKERAQSLAEYECEQFTLLFCKLAHKKFGFTLQELKQLSEEDLKFCINEIRKETKWKKPVGKVIALSLIPVLLIGWIIADGIVNSYIYKFECCYNRLRKFYGEYLPYGFIQNVLRSTIKESFRDENIYFCISEKGLSERG